MADYGLISGIAQGLNAGLDAYNQAQDRQLKIKQYQDDLEIKKLLREQQEKNLQMEQTSKGLISKEGGGFDFSPEKKAEQEADLAYKKAQTTGLLAEAEKKKSEIGKKPLTDPELKAASELRKEFQGRQGVKDFNTIETAYRKIEQAEKNPSAAGDLSLIFSYMKILDPSSTVREGEFANAQNAAGVPDQIMNLYNRAKSGERLNPQQRKDFINQAKAQAQAQAQALQGIEEEFGGLSKRYGVDPGLIYQPRAGGLLQKKSTPIQTEEAIKPGTIDGGYRFKGGDPANPKNWEKI